MCIPCTHMYLHVRTYVYENNNYSFAHVYAHVIYCVVLKITLKTSYCLARRDGQTHNISICISFLSHTYLHTILFFNFFRMMVYCAFLSHTHASDYHYGIFATKHVVRMQQKNISLNNRIILGH